MFSSKFSSSTKQQTHPKSDQLETLKSLAQTTNFHRTRLGSDQIADINKICRPPPPKLTGTLNGSLFHAAIELTALNYD